MLGSEVARLFVSIGADVGEFQREMNAAEQRMNALAGAGSAVKTALVGAFAAAGAAAAGFAAKAASVAASFEQQTNVLAVAARSSGTSLEELRQAAIRVGADTQLVGISASQAADAMTTFYKAGLTTSQIMGDLNGYLAGTAELGGALRAAIDLAAASELDLAQASDAVVIAMSTFGLSAEEARRIADSFVQAADASVASVSDLVEALANVGPTAAAFGWSLEEVNTALAILSTRGIRGAEAGTALKSMMLNLMRPTESVLGKLDELGISLYDQEGRMKSLSTIIAELESAMEGFTEQQRIETAEILAGSYGIKAFNTLLAEGAEGWQRMTEQIANAATVQESAAARTKGFSAAMEQLQGSIEALLINVGTPLIQQFLTPGVRLLSEWIGKLAEMVPSTEQVAAALSALKEGVGNFMAELRAFLANPLLFLRERWPEWQAEIQGAVDSAVQGAVSWLESNVVPLAERLWNALRAWISSATSYVVANAGDLGSDLGTSFGEVLRSATQWLAANVLPFARELLESLGGLLNKAIEMLSTNAAVWGQDYGSFLGSVVRSAIEFLVKAVPELATLLWGAIRGIVGVSIDEGKAASPKVIEVAKALLTFFASFWQAFIGAIVGDPEWPTTLANAIRGIVDNALNELKALPGRFVEFGKSLISGMIDGVESMAEDLKNSITSTVSKPVDWIADKLGIKSPSTVMRELGQDLVRGLSLGVEDLKLQPRLAIDRMLGNTVNYNYTYNLNADLGSRGAEELLRELVSLLRGRGVYAPLPDVG